ncbi:hypothetical protein ACQKPC_07345 [Pseudomonas sp. NPDC089918]|uniref:hypothetical protein n=1 Tax=Pseudomonas sp. NPDC089918 TaxID=3390654 RepID=UPI003D09167B
MNTTHFFPLKHDRHHPPLASESPQDAARADWLYNAAEELLRGNSVIIPTSHASSTRRDC